jgi:hypothetical protein
LDVEGAVAGTSSPLESMYSADFTSLLLGRDGAGAGAGADFLVEALFFPATFDGPGAESFADWVGARSWDGPRARRLAGGSDAGAGAGRFLDTGDDDGSVKSLVDVLYSSHSVILTVTEWLTGCDASHFNPRARDARTRLFSELFEALLIQVLTS